VDLLPRVQQSAHAAAATGSRERLARVRLRGVYETVLYADDVAATARFYESILGLRLVAGPDELMAALRLEDGGVLLIFDPRRASKPGRAVPHGASGAGHVAFSVREGELDAAAAELRAAHGVELERETEWPQGGRSVYFRDPAGNSLELVEGEVWPR
jgi:catechol 2,3-dioxygenase-like lactoylglutathione lyase family enzyme